MTMILCTPHFTDMASRMICLLRTLCFIEEDEDPQLVARCDIEYLFKLAYYQIRLCTDLQFSHTDCEDAVMQELFDDNGETSVNLNKVIEVLLSQEDVGNIVQMLSFDGQVGAGEGNLRLNQSFKSSPSPMKEKGGDTTRANMKKQLSDLNASQFSNMDVTQPNTILNSGEQTAKTLVQQQDDSHPDLTHQQTTAKVNQSAINESRFARRQSIASTILQGGVSAMNNRGQSQLKPGDTTTIDLMYSFENHNKTSFSEDTIKRMTHKLKSIREQNSDFLDPESEMKLQQFLKTIDQIQTCQADFYAQRQLSQMMRSLYLESKLQDLSISQLVKDPQQQEQQMKQNHQSSHSELSVASQRGGPLQGKINLTIQSIFRDYNRQYQSEIKYTLNQYYQKLLQSFQQRGQKISIESQKFQHLGEIAALSQLSYEIEESEENGNGGITTDHMFNLVYQCYDQMFQYARSKELISKYAQLKYAKRVNTIWISYLQGVISKIKQSMQALTCFQESDFFQDSYRLAAKMLEQCVAKLKQVSVDYYDIKRIVLDYNFQVGRLKALLYVSQRYKEENEKIIEEIKIKEKQVRESMEEIDLQLVETFHGVIQRKRTQSIYFETLGQDIFSKCANKGLDIKYVREFLISHLFQYNYWQAQVAYCNFQTKKEIDEENFLNDNFDSHLFDVMRFQFIKQLDEGLFQEIKQEGVMGFDKYRNEILKLGDEQEAIIQKYKNLQAHLQSSPTLGKNGAAAAASKTAQMRSPYSVTGRDGKNKGQVKEKPLMASQELIQIVNQSLQQEYDLSNGQQHDMEKLMQFIQQHQSDLTLEFQNGSEFLRNDFEPFLASHMNFVSLDQTDSQQAEASTNFIHTKGQYSFTTQIRDNPAFTIEKRLSAHTHCEQFFRSLSQQKQSKFIKEFKELRSQALESFVKSLLNLNQPGRFNNFDLRFLSVPLLANTDSTFLCSFMVDSFLKEQEKEAMWENITAHIKRQQSDQDEKAPEQEEEQRTFERLFWLMKGDSKTRKMQLKEKMTRPFFRLFKKVGIRAQVIKDGSLSMGQQEKAFMGNLQAVEAYISEKMLGGEDGAGELGEAVEQFIGVRNTFFERKKIRGVEMFIQGAQNYMQAFNDGEQSPTPMLQEIARQLQSAYDSHLAEYKIPLKTNLQTVQTAFKDKAYKILQKICNTEFLLDLSQNLKLHTSTDSFFKYVKDCIQPADAVLQRMNRGIEFMKANCADEQDEVVYMRMGARTIHSIISGQFQSEDIDLLNQGGPSDDHSATKNNQQQEKRKLIRILSLFVSKLAFVDERISAHQALRYDSPASFLNIHRDRIQTLLDRFNQRSQFQEGLQRLVNIFEIYKTPLAHYQKSYERACKFIRRELIPRVVEADEGRLRYILFDLISSKGSALFKNIVNKLDQGFGKLDLDEPIRVETEKVKGKLRRELDLQVRAFKEFIDLEENQRSASAKQQQIKHQSYRMMQELAALMLLIRIFYVKLEQEENALSASLGLASQKMIEKVNPALH